MNNKKIDGKNFVEVNARFLFRVDGMEHLESKMILINIIDLIHDGAHVNGWDARRIVVSTVDD